MTERIAGAAFERGLTVYPCTSAVDGNVGDAVLLGPPLSVTEDDLDEMVDRLVASVLATLPVLNAHAPRRRMLSGVRSSSASSSSPAASGGSSVNSWPSIARLRSRRTASSCWSGFSS